MHWAEREKESVPLGWQGRPELERRRKARLPPTGGVVGIVYLHSLLSSRVFFVDSCLQPQFVQIWSPASAGCTLLRSPGSWHPGAPASRPHAVTQLKRV